MCVDTIMKTTLLAAGSLLAATFAMPAFGQSGYEVWASDQSNSVAGADGPGLVGSYIWIWDQDAIEAQIAGGPDAQPLPCVSGQGTKKGKSKKGASAATGPCDLNEVFPASLAEYDADGNATGATLGDLTRFGRLHGMLVDPQQRYLTANIFAPSTAMSMG